MTQSSLAVSAEGRDWVVLNASPDLRAQFAVSPALAPVGLRGTSVRAVILTNGDIDHIAGLLSLREGTAFEVIATPAVLSILHDNEVFRVLNSDLVTFREMALDTAFEVAGLRVTPFAVPGKIALFLEDGEPDTQAVGEQTVALRIEAGGRMMHYAPGCAALPPGLPERLTDADMLCFDGTVWADDDMIRSGTGPKTGARMGHMAMSGPEGSLARLAGGRARKVFIHLNNTNPVLRPGPEREAVLEAGWGIAADGEEIVL